MNYSVTRKHFIMDGHWTSPELIAAIIRENEIPEDDIIMIQARYDLDMQETTIEISVADKELSAKMNNELYVLF